MEIPDTFMIGSTGGNLSQRHDLMRIRLYGVLKPVCLPILHQRRVNSDMRYTYPAIPLDRFKEARYWFAHFHH